MRQQIDAIRHTLMTGLAHNEAIAALRQIEDETFMQIRVESWWRRLLRLPYRAVICRRCKRIQCWEGSW